MKKSALIFGFSILALTLKAATLWDTRETAFAPGVTLVSPDGKGKVSTAWLQTIPASPSKDPTGIFIFTEKGLLPLAMEADPSGPILAAWSGSSKFVILVTGPHVQQSLQIIHQDGNQLKAQTLNWRPMLLQGRKILPAGWTQDHDEILGIKRGSGNSVVCLYYRTADYPKAFVAVVTITLPDPDQVKSCSYSFAKTNWLGPARAWKSQLRAFSESEKK